MSLIVAHCTVISLYLIEPLTNAPLALFIALPTSKCWWCYKWFKPVGTRVQGFLHMHSFSKDAVVPEQMAASPGDVFTVNLKFCLMVTSSNVIFQWKATLIQGDPNIIWCEIANIIKLYDIFVSVWVLPGSHPAKEEDAGIWMYKASLSSQSSSLQRMVMSSN